MKRISLTQHLIEEQRQHNTIPAELRLLIEVVSRARIDIEAMRLMVLKAAKAMDVLGNREARVWVHMVKAMVPERVCQIIDAAIQIHGATGVSQWTPLAPQRLAGSRPLLTQTSLVSCASAAPTAPT